MNQIPTAQNPSPEMLLPENLLSFRGQIPELIHRDPESGKTFCSAGNPCVLAMQGVRIGVSNCDVLMDLMKSCYWKCVWRRDAM